MSEDVKNKQITLTVTAQQGEIILAALSKLPYDVVADLIGSIHKQGLEQLQLQVQDKPQE